MNEKRSRKTYNNTLRQRQKEMTRDMIMEALSSLILEGKIHTFNIQDVADRAGISYASVYKHFPSRSAMLKALYEWQNKRNIEVNLEPIQDLEEWPAYSAKLFRNFEENYELRVATIQTLFALNLRPASMEARNDETQDMIERWLPHLDSDMSKRAAGLLRLLSGSMFWMVFRSRYGFSEEETIETMKWALDVLLADLKRRNREREQAPSMDQNAEEKTDDNEG